MSTIYYVGLDPGMWALSLKSSSAFSNQEQVPGPGYSAYGGVTFRYIFEDPSIYSFRG